MSYMSRSGGCLRSSTYCLIIFSSSSSCKTVKHPHIHALLVYVSVNVLLKKAIISRFTEVREELQTEVGQLLEERPEERQHIVRGGEDHHQLACLSRQQVHAQTRT